MVNCRKCIMMILGAETFEPLKTRGESESLCNVLAYEFYKPFPLVKSRSEL